MEKHAKYITIDINCKPIYLNPEIMLECLTYVNSIQKSNPLLYIFDDEKRKNMYDLEPQSNLINLYLLTKNKILSKKMLFLYSKADERNFPLIQVSSANHLTKFSWPTLEYTKIAICLPYDKQTERSVFEVTRKLSLLFNAYKTKVHHPAIMFDCTIQKSFCCGNKPPYGLPELPHLQDHKIDEYNFPAEINWMGYWNKQIVSYLQLNLARAEDIFYRVEELNNGSLMYQLTNEPLIKDNLSHMQLIKNAYNKLAKAGGRNLMQNV